MNGLMPLFVDKMVIKGVRSESTSIVIIILEIKVSGAVAIEAAIVVGVLCKCCYY